MLSHFFFEMKQRMKEGRRAGLALLSRGPSTYYNRAKPCCLPVVFQKRSQHESAVATNAAPNNSKEFWSDAKNLTTFVERLAKKLQIKEPTDWYHVSRKDIEENGGSEMLKRYNNLCRALRVVYPDYPWQANRFLGTRTPNGFWNDKKNLMNAMDAAEKHLGIKAVEDWYSVTLLDLHEVGFPSHFTKMQLVQLLCERYPDYKWEKVYLLRGKFAQQKRLEKALETLFPGVEIIVNARKEAGIINPNTGDVLELDFYLPSLNIAFEYQEVHHYKSSDYTYEPLSVFQERDALKKKLVEERGITLIVIPFWWDGKRDSLVATLKKARPDLLPDIQVTQEPIPEEMPGNILQKQKAYIEDIGEPTNACFLTRSDTDPTDWWMFEKYDGLRGFWNPVKGAFYSRNGHRFTFPSEIICAMPDMFLDGEIWFGRDNFQEASKVAARADVSRIDWDKFKYMVYDVPNVQGTYEQRYNYLVEKLGNKQLPYLEVAQKQVCTGMEHLEQFFQDVIDKGGEGVILRNPATPLEPGRSRGYLKHKKYRDAEAKILETVGPGQWKCILPNGIVFTALPGTSEFLKRCDPKPGDIVTFKHRGFMIGSKKPKSPVLYRLRTDLNWDEVVKNWDEKTPRVSALPLRRPVKTRKSKGHWGLMDNRRQFFLEFAKEANLNPLSVEDWEKVTPTQIRSKKGGKSILSSFDNSLIRVLRETFPELAWTKQVEEKKPKHFWKDAKNCRNFFDAFAKDNGFDPLDIKNWYSADFHQMLSSKGGWTLRDRNGGFKLALKNAYPELEFDAKWIAGEAAAKHFWKDAKNCRTFFDSIAQQKELNPLDTATWNSIDMQEILSHKEGSLIRYQNGSLAIALRNAYPELKLANVWGKDKAASVENRIPKRHWKDIHNCRAFFDEFAKEVGINPLRAEDWYPIDFQQLLVKKGGRAIRSVYGGLKKALQAAYPEIQFEEKWKGVERKSKEYWMDIKNCRAFFDSYANKNGFNPLDVNNWYSTTTERLSALTGARSITDLHNGIRNALKLAYPELKFDYKWHGERLSKDYWKEPKNCRTFFDAFAKEEGFDGSKEDSWYSVNLHKMLLKPGGRAIRDQYAGFKRALKYAYPELQFADRWPRGQFL